MAKNVSSAPEEEDNEACERPTNHYCPKVGIKLLPYKSFYFLFFSAVGSLYPYLAIFYKQLWLSAQQTGILIGIRPLLQVMSSSLWGIVADSSNKSKVIFLVSLVAWLPANFSLSLVGHPKNFCPCRGNKTTTMFDNVAQSSAGNITRNSTESNNDMSKYKVHQFDGNNHKRKGSPFVLIQSNRTVVKQENVNKNGIINKAAAAAERDNKERKDHEFDATGKFRRTVHGITTLEVEDVANESSYHKNHRIFLLLLFITILGTLLAAPAIPFADAATLHVLGDDMDFYGKQRQWGALGWGVSSFVIGVVVSTTSLECNCNVLHAFDYRPCFYAFAVLMFIAFIPGLFFCFQERPTSGINVVGRVRTLLNLDCIAFLVTILILGCSWGLLQTFLLWHLQDLGGTQVLFSVIAAAQCLSEVVFFNIAGHLIKLFGHHNVLYLSLVFSSLRFTLYGVIKNPWLVLPIEFLHGLSTTLVWAVAVSFISLKTGVAATIQGILSGFHWGLGLGGGAIFCGVLVNLIGPADTFIIFGVIPFLNLVILITMRHSKFFGSQSEEQRSLLEQSDNEDHQSIPFDPRASSATERLPHTPDYNGEETLIYNKEQ